jgi:hypothetical protein
MYEALRTTTHAPGIALHEAFGLPTPRPSIFFLFVVGVVTWNGGNEGCAVLGREGSSPAAHAETAASGVDFGQQHELYGHGCMARSRRQLATASERHSVADESCFSDPRLRRQCRRFEQR